MNNKRTLRQVAVAVMLLVAFLFQGTWALAGTTGGLNGTVTDENGAAVAGASVKVISASQSASASTDASGHFNFLSLAPDTYTVSIEKDGYSPLSYAGVTVFADNQLALQFKMQKALKTIARVTSRSAGDVVKSGVGSDIYSVNSTAIQAASSLGGGGNLNSAYSAIASVPGVNVTIGGSGWNQNTYVRGSQSYFTGYEYDGVPVNRAFDNYNASTESNLGLSELQVYTGGGPASITSSGTSGFINQVIKTGTYPGFASLGGGIGSSAFYHQGKVEAGGATPDRRFSYYVGLSGYDQAFRLIDNNNGAGFMGPGGIYGSYATVTTALPIASSDGPFPLCNPDGTTPGPIAGGVAPATGCLFQYTGLSGAQSFIQNRENVVNFHFAIPRKNGQRDDLQALWSSSLLKTYYYGDINDLGGANNWMLAATGASYSPPGTAAPNFPGFIDSYVINSAFGTPVGGVTPMAYYSPDSPAHAFGQGQIPANQQDAIYNDQGIVKLQYTHQLGDKAFARLVGYTFFSDWNQTGPYATVASYNPGNGSPAQALAANYLLNTHTAGGELQLVDQITDKHLLQFTANYTKANVLRWNNTGFATGSGNPVGILQASPGTPGGYICWSAYVPPSGGNPASGDAPIPCYQASQNTVSAYGGAAPDGSTCPVAGTPTCLVGPAAAAAGAKLVNLWNGYESGSYNTVQPKFLNLSLSDQIRPSDKLLLNAGVRYDNYVYGLPNAADTADKFYAAQVANYICYDTNPGNPNPVYTNPLLPGQAPPANPVKVNGDCNTYISGKLGTPVTTYVHPNGTTQDGVAAPTFSTNMPSSYTMNFWSLRVSGTYTASPDTVWRASAGRFIEPPISASVQYLNKSGNNVSQWANFMDLGFFTPFHPVPAQTSAQYDLSLERHIRGTDMSFKISPFFNFTNGYQEQSFIGAGFVTQVPVGDFRSTGVEAAFTKGDFSKNGLSGSLALTYTKAQVNFQGGRVNGNGQNQINIVKQAISDYNNLTTGSAFYCQQLSATGKLLSSAGVSSAAGCLTGAGSASSVAIANPYFGAKQQGLPDANGWYAPPGNVMLPGVNTNWAFYDAPWVGNIILNYRKDKWAVTPSVQWASGSSYGSPIAVQGVDPRLCTKIDTTAGAAPNQCDYASLKGAGATATGLLYIPNPQTGSFDGVGQYHNPTILTGNVAFSYDVSPKVSVNLTLANVFHTCFGGSKEPWTSAYGAGTNVCGYAANGLYVSNFQRGAGYATPGNPATYSAAANGTNLYPWQFQSYAPTTGSAAGVIPPPFNAYLTVNVKL